MAYNITRKEFLKGFGFITASILFSKELGLTSSWAQDYPQEGILIVPKNCNIYELADFQGVRVCGGKSAEIFAAELRQRGANFIAMSSAELYQAMTTGVCQSVLLVGTDYTSLEKNAGYLFGTYNWRYIRLPR
jgi:hypothetical protein